MRRRVRIDPARRRCRSEYDQLLSRRSNCMAVESSSPSSDQSTLRRNAIGLPGVLFQSITTMAPASAVSFSLGAAVAVTGGALPLAVLIALLVCALIALNIGALAKYLPSAVGVFTYVHPRPGSQGRLIA